MQTTLAGDWRTLEEATGVLQTPRAQIPGKEGAVRQLWGDYPNPILVVKPAGPSPPPNSAKKEADRVVCLRLA